VVAFSKLTMILHKLACKVDPMIYGRNHYHLALFYGVLTLHLVIIGISLQMFKDF